MKQAGVEDATKTFGLEDVSKQIQDLAKPMIEAAEATAKPAVEAEKPQDAAQETKTPEEL